MSSSLFKHFMVYFLAIAVVVILFSSVTTYGEANLPAPSRIDGSYKISSSNLPECLNNQALQLIVKQSGIFINASLVSENNLTKRKNSVEDKPSLFGKWQNQQLLLSGTLTRVASCPSSDPVVIRAQVTDNNLEGTLFWHQVTSEFLAQKDISEELKPAAH